MNKIDVRVKVMREQYLSQVIYNLPVLAVSENIIYV